MLIKADFQTNFNLTKPTPDITHSVKRNQGCWWQVFIIKSNINIYYVNTQVQDLKVFLPLWQNRLLKIFRVKTGLSVHSQRPEFTTNSINWYFFSVRSWHEQKFDKVTNQQLLFSLFLGYQQVNNFCSRKLKIVELGKQQAVSHRHCKQHIKYFNLLFSNTRYICDVQSI